MFFSNNRIGSMAADVTVEAAAGYDNEHAIYDVMIESCENQEKLFTAAIFCDMQEAAMLHEGAAVEDIEAFQEASIKGFFQKIKEFLKKLWAKIKAIFHSFIAKLNSWFMKSDKSFASKYEKEISNKNLDKFKMDIEAPKAFPEIKTPNSFTGFGIKDKDESELVDFALSILLGNGIESSGFEKSLHERCFEDKKEVTGKSFVTAALKRLKDKSIVKTVESNGKNLDKLFKNIISDIDKFEKSHVNRAAKVQKSSDGKKYDIVDSSDKTYDTMSDNNADTYSANIRKMVKAYQKAIQLCTSGLIREAKFQVAQDRRIVAKAVAFNPKKHMNESYEEADEIATFISEAAEWDLLTDLR